MSVSSASKATIHYSADLVYNSYDPSPLPFESASTRPSEREFPIYSLPLAYRFPTPAPWLDQDTVWVFGANYVERVTWRPPFKDRDKLEQLEEPSSAIETTGTDTTLS